jgi:hypothetical protein
MYDNDISSTSGYGQEKTKISSPVETQLLGVDSRIGSLKDVVDELRHRLEPILGPGKAMIDDDSNNVPSPLTSGLTSRIRNHNNGLFEIIQNLEDLRDRLEI